VAVPCVGSRQTTDLVFNAVVVAINPSGIDHEVQFLKVLQQFASISEAMMVKARLADTDIVASDSFSEPVLCKQTRSLLSQRFNKETLPELPLMTAATLPEFCSLEDEILKTAATMHLLHNVVGDLLLEDVEIPITFQKDRLMGASAAMQHVDFNAFKFTMGELSEMVVHMLYAFELPLVMGISQTQVENFVKAVELNYNQSNPYHNYHHAVTVFHRVAITVWNEPDLFDTMVSSDLFSLLISALCHDIDHPGLNNEHHKNAQTRLSIQYDNMSVTEQHHCAVTSQLIFDESIMLLKSVTEAVQKQILRQIGQAIIYTDMFQHHHLIHRFNFFKSNNTDSRNTEYRETTISMVLHMADMMNQCDALNMADVWERLLSQEFYAQVVVEKQMGLPSASFMDVQSELDFYRNQLFFTTCFCQPLFQGLAETYPSLAPRLAQLKQNKTAVEAIIKQMADKQTDSRSPQRPDPRTTELETFTFRELWNTVLAEISVEVEQFGVELLLKATVTSLHRKLVGDKFRLCNTLKRAVNTAILCPEVWLLVVELSLEALENEQCLMRWAIYESSEGEVNPPTVAPTIDRRSTLQSNMMQDSLLVCKKFIESVGGWMTTSTDGPNHMHITASFMLPFAKKSSRSRSSSVKLPSADADLVTTRSDWRFSLTSANLVSHPKTPAADFEPDVIMNLDIEVVLSAKWKMVRTVLTDLLQQWGCKVREVAQVDSVDLRESLIQKPKLLVLIEYTQYRWLVEKSDWWLDYSAVHPTGVLVMGTKSQAMHAEQSQPFLLSEGRFLCKPLDPEHLYIALSKHVSRHFVALLSPTTSRQVSLERSNDPTRPDPQDPSLALALTGVGLTQLTTSSATCAAGRSAADQQEGGLESERPANGTSGQNGENEAKPEPKHKASALVVEDCMLAFRMVQASLKLHKIMVTPAYNGQAALSILEENRTENGFDFILMDMDMPVMNGEQAVKQIRKMEEEGKIRPQFIVAMSAELVDMGQSNDFDAFMPKPIYPSKIEAVLHSESWRDTCVFNGSSGWDNFNPSCVEQSELLSEEEQENPKGGLYT